jgi:hypothetical protein
MKTLTAPVLSSLAADVVAPVELYDIYLKTAISTPVGTTNIIRICTYPGYVAGSSFSGFQFFTPKQSPEPVGTQGNAATYYFLPIDRDELKTAAKFQNDKFTFAVSNISGEYGAMIAATDWQDCPVVVRKVNVLSASLTADDCILLYSGKIDLPRIDRKQVQFQCSNGLATFAYSIPNEAMHSKCRFSFADDMCTVIPYRTENLKAKTVGSGSTTTRIKSSDFNEDTAVAPWVQQVCTVNAATDRISLTAHGLIDGGMVSFSADVVPGGLTAGTWYYVLNATANDFQLALTSELLAAIDITSAGSNVTLTSQTVYGTDVIRALADASITASSEFGSLTNTPVTFIQIGSSGMAIMYNGHVYVTHYMFKVHNGSTLKTNQKVKFGGTTMPSPLVAGTYYYALNFGSGLYALSATPYPSAPIDITSAGLNVVMTTNQGFTAAQVKRTNVDSYWRFGNTADWGTSSQGYWQIPDAQAGLKNAALKPYIQFDLGSAQALRVWRITSLDQGRESMCRLILLFSSNDASTWKFETYYELPPIGGQPFDVLVPKASSARYWRICVRSRWAETFKTDMMKWVEAYAAALNWWRDGWVTFDSGTATAALRGVTRRVLGSYAGQVVVEDLPVAPAAGDTFVIRRGCSRTFNACAERLNTENFGGFNSMPSETVVK